MSDRENENVSSEAAESPERRDFLKKAGRFAVVTPAAAAVLLSTSMDAEATGLFRSGGDQYKKHHKKIRKTQHKKIKKIKKILHKIKYNNNWKWW